MIVMKRPSSADARRQAELEEEERMRLEAMRRQQELEEEEARLR